MQENMRRRYSEPQGSSCGNKYNAQPRGCTCGNRYNAQPQTRQEVPTRPDCPNMVLAMAYVKSQPFVNLYNPCDAWKNGTLFADLNLPYTGGRTSC